ncbi:hypothetical protein CFC21_048539 [Triticum aestivum]|uniref:Uncharacterized protein n=2 Tax=Triticum aestivum TaxID=4565 RepID=A0A3B6DLU6_WHEAT|nr:uncharacterized protein LOC123050280 [Triticum aestivum]KAF7038342.1 hypothetical protein CFC21_048539 [Triticum aestivum]
MGPKFANMRSPGAIMHFAQPSPDVYLVKTRMGERSTRASSSPLLSSAIATTMEKLLTVVCVSSLLLATLADDASSRSSLQHPSLDGLQGRVLGRKGREEPAHHHYRREGEHEEQHEVVPMGAESGEERKKGSWRNEDEEAVAAEGLISSADYSGVAMHGHSSPPAHKKHPRP